MTLVVISPEHDDPLEPAVLSELFAAGLARYHVRKPTWSAETTESWLLGMPHEWRSRLVLHHHHELVGRLGLGGIHFRDSRMPAVPADSARSDPPAPPVFTSRSCHDLATLRATLGHYDSVFFSPVFPSLSKPGHAPPADSPRADLVSLLARRTPAERRTTILALGGITPETALRALALGFDGVAALGAIWQSPDPVRAFLDLQSALTRTPIPTLARTATVTVVPTVTPSLATRHAP